MVAAPPRALPIVLAVDDEPDNLGTIRRALRGRYEVICAGSARDALEIVRAKRVDLVLSDQRMPGMSGIELLEQVRVLSPETVRLVLSAWSQAGELLDAINRGSVSRYLLKPISAGDLRDAIAGALAGTSVRWSEQITVATDDRAPLDDVIRRLGLEPRSPPLDLEAAAGVVLLDLDAAGSAPDDVLALVKRQGGELIVLSGAAPYDEALRLVRLGARALLRKPVVPEEALRLLESALERRRLAREVQRERDPRGPFAELIGSSEAMRRLISTLASVASVDSTILLRGETGTGKELAARAIHRASARRDGPFVPVHCAAMAPALLESELFGHERGAFTGANERRTGRFERATGGTLFLDEIGEIPPQLQVKLLRVLQERVVERVGGHEVVPIDVRLVAATHRDLEAMVESGEFREDLYYRINVIPVFLPPLRDRLEDLPELARYLLEQCQAATGRSDIGLPEAVIDRLRSQRWPGNVRELRNTIERLVAFTPSGAAIDPALLDVVAAPRARSAPAVDEAGTIHEIMDRYEERVLRHFLELHDGNQTHAAQRLGLTRQALAKRLQRLGLTRGGK